MKHFLYAICVCWLICSQTADAQEKEPQPDQKKAEQNKPDPPNLVRIVVVDGQPRTKFIAGESTYLMAFFDTVRAKDDVRHRYKVITLADDFKLNQAAADLIDIVILCNVKTVSKENARLMDGIVRRGGSVIVFVGNKVDPDIYNQTFFQDGKGFLPAKLKDHVSVKGITPKFLKGKIASMNVDSATLPKFQRIYEVSDVNRRKVQMIATLSDGKPLLLAKQHGKGRCLLFTSTIDLAWNKLAINPLFVLTMLESIRYARGGQAAGN